jgi:hypothetical protein
MWSTGPRCQCDQVDHAANASIHIERPITVAGRTVWPTEPRRGHATFVPTTCQPTCDKIVQPASNKTDRTTKVAAAAAATRCASSVYFNYTLWQHDLRSAFVMNLCVEFVRGSALANFIFKNMTKT